MVIDFDKNFPLKYDKHYKIDAIFGYLRQIYFNHDIDIDDIKIPMDIINLIAKYCIFEWSEKDNNDEERQSKIMQILKKCYNLGEKAEFVINYKISLPDCMFLCVYIDHKSQCNFVCCMLYSR